MFFFWHSLYTMEFSEKKSISPQVAPSGLQVKTREIDEFFLIFLKLRFLGKM